MTACGPTRTSQYVRSLAAPEDTADNGRKRPRQRTEWFAGKQKVLMKWASAEEIEAAAVGARYAPSDYHCKENGRLRRRVKPATP
jgi:hypothetical protein